MQKDSFSPYTAKITFDDLHFDFHVISIQAKEQHDRGETLSSNGEDRRSFYGYPQFRFIKDKMIEEGDLIFDIGGEYGFTTLLFSAWAGSKGKVFTFEPNQWFFNCIKRNLKLNGVGNAKVVERAVSAKTDAVLSYGGSSIKRTGEGKLDVISVCLDDYAEFFPDFIKMDVEGYEVQVLEGAKKVLEQYPKLQIELHTDLLGTYDASVESFFDLIDTSAYDFFIQWEGNDDADVVEFDPRNELVRLSNLSGKDAVQLFALPRLEAMEKRKRMLTLHRKLRRDLKLFWTRF